MGRFESRGDPRVAALVVRHFPLKLHVCSRFPSYYDATDSGRTNHHCVVMDDGSPRLGHRDGGGVLLTRFPPIPHSLPRRVGPPQCLSNRPPLPASAFWAAGGLSLAAGTRRRQIGVARGSGSRGGGNLGNVAGLGENVVALCDRRGSPRWGRRKSQKKKLPDAKTYTDWRDARAKDIDAIVISTPITAYRHRRGGHGNNTSISKTRPSVYQSQLLKTIAAEQRWPPP